jgi:uncharacterized protein YcfJ
MDHRFFATRLTIAALSGLMVLASCGPSNTGAATVQGTPGADPELVNRAAIMTRTVLEGAALGAAASVIGNRVYGAPVLGISVTTTAGAVTGTYLGYLQQKFATEEEILNQVRRDLDQNSQEIAATINVMRSVLAVQQADLARLRAEAQSGTATEEQVNAGVAAARANLTEMQVAIDGATFRQSEFQSARSMVPATNGSAIDPDLAALSNQIAQMREVASDLSSDL